MIGFHRQFGPFETILHSARSAATDGAEAELVTDHVSRNRCTNEAQVSVVAAKLENETRSDHRTIVLLQIQETRAVVGCLCIHIGYLLAVLSSAVNPPLQAAILAPARDLRCYCGGKDRPIRAMTLYSCFA